MHERSLISGLMRQIEETARERGSRRVAALKVWLGALTHLSPEHFRDHFIEASRGGVADGARLEIEVSGDLSDPRAHEIVLDSIDLEVED
jgi:hydrogenase nickel incorporation protein HypA/HybF